MPHEPITIHRDQLYEEVWAEPVRTVAKRYAVSDVALAKICRKLGVPIPGRGYWARKAAGQVVERVPLPPATEGRDEQMHIVRWRAENAAPSPPTSEVQDHVVAEQPPEPTIVVPETLTEPHELVETAQRRLARQKPVEGGWVHCWRHRCLAVRVSPASLDRALRIMDALIKACEERKLRFEVTRVVKTDLYARHHAEPEDPSNTTRVFVDGEWIVVRLNENYRVERDAPPTPPAGLRKHERDWWVRDHRPPARRAPSGVLELSINSGPRVASWKDACRRPLQMRLDEIMAELAAMSAAVKEGRAAAERRREREIEESQRRWEAEKKATEERRRDEEMSKALQQWRLARDLRDYMAEARRIVTDAQCSIRADGWVDSLIKWADSYAERIDPLTRLRKEIAQHLADRAGTDKERQRVEAEQRAREQANLAEELQKAVTDWRQARDIREYVAAMTAAVVGNGSSVDKDSDFERSAAWALTHADRIDPVAMLGAEARRVATGGADMSNGEERARKSNS